MNDEQNEKKSFLRVIKDSFKELGETFVAFIKAPRALWGVNLPYIVEGIAYFGILTIWGKYASENIKLTDPQAGFVYGAITGGITLSMLFLGGVVDKIGVRKSLWLSLGVMVVGRSVISLGGSFSLGEGINSPMFFITCGGMLLMVIAYGLYQPAAYAGVKRYTNPKTSAMAYAVLYGMMNLGAFLSGPISSVTRKQFDNEFPPNGLTAVFWAFTILTLLATVASFMIIKKSVDRAAVDRVKKETEAMEQEGEGDDQKEVEKEEEKVKTEAVKINQLPFIIYTTIALIFLGLFIAVKAGKVDQSERISLTLMIVAVIVALWEFLRHRPDHPFRNAKFMTFIFVLIPVQTLFAHNWLTLPYYFDRAFRGTTVSENFEVFSNLNPLLIFVLAPIIAGLTTRVKIYKMMVWGTLVMAAPTFLLVLGTNVYLVLIYIVVMTIGEAMWQPRFLQWIAEIAPEGRTGAYMGIGQFPWFLTKILTSLYSGHFIANYVPNPDVSGAVVNPEPMWLFYSFIAMITPVALILMSKWLGVGMEKKH
ncbi:MAG: peptide MFS transporter [bacterium]|nr:peptide MFS transporter [bacterium]